jgi:hypothetical protein
LDSDSISIRTCFLNLLLEFIRTTYLGNLYPIGLPESHPNSLPELHPSALPERHTRILLEQLARTPPEHLTRSHQCLLGLIRSYPAELPYPILLLVGLILIRPYTVLPGQITLPNLFPIGLLPTRSYPATLPDFLTRPGNTSLHPTAYPALPNHLTRPSTLQLDSPKNFLIGLPP